MTIEPKLHFKLQSKTTQGIKKRVGFLKVSLYNPNAVISVSLMDVMPGRQWSEMGLIELSRQSFLQKG
jgi:hypothetical protein